jgi:hypothetical protein
MPMTAAAGPATHRRPAPGEVSMIDPADPWSTPMTLVIVVVGSEVTDAERMTLAGLAHDGGRADAVEVVGHGTGRAGG